MNTNALDAATKTAGAKDMSELKQQLITMSACNEAVEWVGDRTLKEAWSECERGDWMIWLAGKLGIDRKLLVLAACDCAEQALKFVQDGEERPRIAIETARAWCNGDATIEQVRAAADAASVAASAADAADAAASAAASVAYAAADATGYAVYASAAASAADAASLKLSAELVRTRIPFDLINLAPEQKP